MARRMLVALVLLLMPGAALAQSSDTTPKSPAVPVRFDPRVAVVKSVIEEGLQPHETGAQPVSFRGADGVTIFGDFYPASGESRGTVLLFHAANSNRGEYV